MNLLELNIFKSKEPQKDEESLEPVFKDIENIKWPNKNSKTLFELVKIRGELEYKKSFFGRRVANQGAGKSSIQKIRGGEYLLNLNSDIIPRKDLGKAFEDMPKEAMDEFAYHLIRKQIEDFNHQLTLFRREDEKEDEIVDKETHFSINLEHGLTIDGLKTVLELFEKIDVEDQKKMVIEIMEDGFFMEEQFAVLKEFSERNDFHFSLDDLTSGTHDLSNEENILNLKSLMNTFGEKLKFIKIDFDTVKNLAKATEGESVALEINIILENVKEFAQRWEEHFSDDDMNLPAIVIESLPFDLKKGVYYLILEDLAKKQGYIDIMYQFQNNDDNE